MVVYDSFFFTWHKIMLPMYFIESIFRKPGKNMSDFNDSDELFGEEPSKLQQFQSDTFDYNSTIKMLGKCVWFLLNKWLTFSFLLQC